MLSSQGYNGPAASCQNFSGFTRRFSYMGCKDYHGDNNITSITRLSCDHFVHTFCLDRSVVKCPLCRSSCADGWEQYQVLFLSILVPSALFVKASNNV